jgi:probable O-glycosylation ligase (exosortase A-associated)
VSARAIILLIAIVPCMPVCFFRPFFGIIMWTIVSFASPQWYAWGSAYYFPCAEMIAIPTLLGFVVFTRGWWSRMVSRESILLVIFWAWCTLTTIISTSTPLFEPHADATWYRWQFVSKVLLMTFITMGVVDSFERLRILVLVTAGCFTFYVVKALPFIVMTGGSFRLYGPPNSMVEDNNDLGLALNMTLPLLFFLAQTEANRKVKRLLGALFFAVVIGIGCTYSRGALLGLATVMILMVLNSKRRMFLMPVLTLAILVAILFAPDKWKDRMDFSKKERTMDLSAYSRINAWTFSWNLANDYPITGGGFDTFTKELFDRYAPNSSDIHGPHSIYFGVLAEHGFVGLALYMTVVLSCFASVRRIIRTADHLGDEDAASYARMFQFSLIGFLTCGLFLGRAYFDYYFCIVCCIVILKKVCFCTWRDVPVNDFEVQEQAA